MLNEYGSEPGHCQGDHVVRRNHPMSVPILSTAQLRDQLAAAIDHVHFNQHRYLITRRGRGIAALVMPHDLERAEEFERKSLCQKRLEQDRMMEAWARAKDVGAEGDELAQRDPILIKGPYLRGRF